MSTHRRGWLLAARISALIAALLPAIASASSDAASHSASASASSSVSSSAPDETSGAAEGQAPGSENDAPPDVPPDVPPDAALAPIRVQLKWTHAFQFAGYYAAQTQGYYRDAGLRVTLIEASPDTDVVAEVVSGRAQFGIGTSGLLLARAAGQPVVALATIFQHSPLVLLARRDQAPQSIHDLAGQPVMIERQAEELLAYLAAEGVPLDTIDVIAHQFDYRDLIDGRVAAISAYSTNEVFFVRQAGMPFAIYSPRSAGIDFYGDTLFTSETELDRHPREVAAFRDASLRGWAYALAHPEEIIEDILARDVSGPPPTREFLAFEAAQTRDLIRADLVEIGYMNPGRWRHIAEVYADLGMLARDFPVEEMLYGQDQPRAVPAWLWATLAGALALILLSFAILWQFRRVNRRLLVTLAESARNEQSLRASEQRYRLLFERSPAGVFLFDRHPRLLDCNARLASILKSSRERLIGLDLDALRDQSVLPALRAALRGEEGLFEGLYRATTSDAVVWLSGRAAPLQDDDGQIVGGIGVFEDVSERKYAETALETSRRELEQANRALRQSNQEATAMAERAEAANRAKSQFLANMSHEIRTPMNAILGMTHLAQRTGLNDHQRGYLNEIQAAAETLLVIIDDILDFSRIEANKLVLEQAPFHPRQVLEHVERILGVKAREKGIALRLELATERERDSSARPLGAPNDPSPGASAGGPAVEQPEQGLGKGLSQELDQVRDQELGQLLGDPLRLGQVLINLVNNAIKFTTRGQVVLRIAPAQTAPAPPGIVALDFIVQDTGPGMPREQIEQLFEPFNQGDSSTTRRHGGTGLGLAISRELVERMGGKLWVESTPGQGSTFGFTLVFERVTAAPPADHGLSDATASTHAPTLDLRGRRLLVVDDNRVNRVLVEELLQLFGPNIQTAESGEDALARVTSEPFDLVLMDIQMPGMDGLTATRRIRAWERQVEREQLRPRHLPIIAMTAHAIRGDRAKSLAAGMDAHLTKPIDANRLFATLAHWLPPLPDAGASRPETGEIAPGPPHQPSAPDPMLPRGDFPPFDIPLALRHSNDNPALLLKLVAAFVAQFTDLPAALRAHLRASDWQQARVLAHSLKSTAATLGLPALAEAARDLETAIAPLITQATRQRSDGTPSDLAPSDLAPSDRGPDDRGPGDSGPSGRRPRSGMPAPGEIDQKPVMKSEPDLPDPAESSPTLMVPANPDDESMRFTVKEIERLLPAALAAAQALLDAAQAPTPAPAPDPAEPTETPPLSEAELRAALETLRAKLAMNALDARADFEKVRQSLDARLAGPSVPALAAALAKLDFRTASQNLEEICARLT